MLYICIPAHDDSRTVGVLLWKIRETMAQLGRDYHVLVLDDGSRDGTAELLQKYKQVLPLAVLSNDRRRGCGRAVERLLREAAGRARYPKRDAMVVMQADFTDPPEHLAALVKRLEGGADIVASVPSGGSPAPWPVRVVRRLASLLAGRRSAPAASGRAWGFRLYRAKVVKAAIEASAGSVLLSRNGRAADAELFDKLAPFARRVAEAPAERRCDLSRRKSRRRPFEIAREGLGVRRAGAGIVLWAWCAALGATAAPAAVQGQEFVRDTLRATVPAPANIPFSVGEELRYKVKAGVFNVGEGSMSIPRIDTVAGFPAYAAEWRIKGGWLFYKIDSKFYSWMDEKTLVSRRFIRDQDEGGRETYKEFLFFPEDRRFQRVDYDTAGIMPTSLPLDDVAFVYFARTLPLVVGETLAFNRFYKEEGNPVVIRVLRKDRRKVKAGTFNTIVLQPIIRTDGLFAEGGQAEIHLSDDDRRLLVYMQVHLGMGINLSLHLEEIVSTTSAGLPGGDGSPGAGRPADGRQATGDELPPGSVPASGTRPVAAVAPRAGDNSRVPASEARR